MKNTLIFLVWIGQIYAQDSLLDSINALPKAQEVNKTQPESKPEEKFKKVGKYKEGQDLCTDPNSKECIMLKDVHNIIHLLNGKVLIKDEDEVQLDKIEKVEEDK